MNFGKVGMLKSKIELKHCERSSKASQKSREGTLVQWGKKTNKLQVPEDIGV